MKQFTQIYQQGFNIEASLVNVDSLNNPRYLPLKYSAIKYLEYTDIVSSCTLSGYAVLDNFNDLINNSPVFDWANLYNNFFNFRAEQLIGGNQKFVSDNSFVCNNIYTIPSSEVESNLVISFDDIFFGTLKNKTINEASEVSRYKSGTTSAIMKNILTDYNQYPETNVGDWNETSGNVNLNFDPTSSIYDIFFLAYMNNYTSNTGSYTDSVFNILKCVGDDFFDEDQKYILEPINQRFLKLYSSIKSGVMDMRDTVIEGIVEPGSKPEDSKTGLIRGYSECSDLQILQPDPQVIRDTYRNIVVESVNDGGSSLIDVIPITQSLDNFYRLFCNNPNYKLDVPFDVRSLENPNNLAVNARKVSAFYPELEPGNMQAKVYNTILLNSKAITFRVKGQLYRKSGVFIYFQPRRDGERDKHYQNLVGFWYIVKVVHIFNGDTYDNVITCVNPFVKV